MAASHTLVRVSQGVGIAGATGKAGRGMEDWRKSSYSGANGGSCVETASGAGVILVRDTTDRDGFTLSVPAEGWAKFTATILANAAQLCSGSKRRRLDPSSARAIRLVSVPEV